MQALLASGASLSRNPASRFSFIRQQAQTILLFVDGQCFDCAGDMALLAERLCARPTLIVEAGLAASTPVAALIAVLVDQGSVAFDDVPGGED